MRRRGTERTADRRLARQSLPCTLSCPLCGERKRRSVEPRGVAGGSVCFPSWIHETLPHVTMQCKRQSAHHLHLHLYISSRSISVTCAQIATHRNSMSDWEKEKEKEEEVVVPASSPTLVCTLYSSSPQQRHRRCTRPCLPEQPPRSCFRRVQRRSPGPHSTATCPCLC